MTVRAATSAGCVLVVASACAPLIGCGPPAPDPVPDDAFAFGVFGDGPYYSWERGRFRRVLADAGRADVAWLIHVGDLLWYPCSDEAYRERRAQLDAVDYPVVYTPGDNEWTDCHEDRPGGYDPLGRLSAIRRTFFDRPDRSLGGRPLALTPQARDTAYSEFVENARWTRGGFVFATLHVVGSTNGADRFDGRSAAHDAEVERRTRAALAWMDSTFSVAHRDSATGVVLALHAEMGLTPGVPRDGYERLIDRLRDHATAFRGTVLLIHGDHHELTIDHPLRDTAGRVIENFTRLETYGSPEIGWVRVVVDTVTGEVRFDSRLMRGWW